MCRKKVVGIDLNIGSFTWFTERIAELAKHRISSYVCVANAHMAVEAYRDGAYAAMVNGADLVTPDGMPLAKGIALLHGIRQERVAGMDLLPAILKVSSESGLSVYFYGSTDAVLDAIVERAQKKLPHLRIAGVYAPPFRDPVSDEINADVARINASGANIVLVALGCPKQERWMFANRGKINAVMVGVGGAFPVYAGHLSRAPLIMQRLSLEWLFRLCQSPRRLFKRYLITNVLFIYLLAKELLFSKVLPASSR